MPKDNKTTNYEGLLDKFKELYEIIYPLIPGPNKYKTLFGQILEGVVRKDFFTMQTVLALIAKIKDDNGYLIVFAGSILDLSRRMFEDMIAMVYINIKGKTKYSKRFIDFITVEDKADIDFLDIYGLYVDKEFRKEIGEKYSKLSVKKREKKNWASLDIESMINFIAKETKMSESQKQLLLKQYLLGNRKNHVSSADIWAQGSSNQTILEKLAEDDIFMGLIIASQSILWVSLIFVNQIENSKETKEKLYDFWKKVNNGKAPPQIVLDGKE